MLSILAHDLPENIGALSILRATGQNVRQLRHNISFLKSFILNLLTLVSDAAINSAFEAL
jgi:hypothetical protein